jgi:hypothetical protein
MEADLVPRNHPERWDLIDGSLGEESYFHRTFGYYAQGVDETTAMLPEGWRERLIPIRGPNTRGATGWTLEVHDLLVSKLIAGRPKDLAFATEALRAGLADKRLLSERLAATAIDERLRTHVGETLRTLA